MRNSFVLEHVWYIPDMTSRMGAQPKLQCPAAGIERLTALEAEFSFQDAVQGFVVLARESTIYCDFLLRSMHQHSHP